MKAGIKIELHYFLGHLKKFIMNAMFLTHIKGKN